MIIKLLVDGGDMKPGPAIAQKLGPLGINIGKVVLDVNLASKDFKGVKVPIELDIAKNKTYTIKVLSPPTAELLKKELAIEKGSGDHKKVKAANASIEQIISVAKIKSSSLLATNFKSAVKQVVGSCVSLEILIENKEPKEIIQEIDSGKFDLEINSQKTDTSKDKRKQLDNYFSELKTQEAAATKKAEEEKLAEEAKKTEATASAPAASAAGKASAPAAGKPAAGAKKEAAPAAGKASAGKPAAGAKKESAKPSAKKK